MLSPFILVWTLTLGQIAHPQPVADPGVEPFRVLVVAGFLGGEEEFHPFGGVEAGWAAGRFGVQTTGMYGRGNGFSSILAGAGPSLRQSLGQELTLILWGGGGWYREGRSPGIARNLPVAIGGASIQFPAGPLLLSAGATALTGRYSSQSAPAAVPVQSIRFSLGVGR